MATKAQVIAKAKATGCTLDINELDAAVHAPKGKLLNGEMHISSYDFEFYTKAETWSNLLSDMSYLEDCSGSKYCNC